MPRTEWHPPMSSNLEEFIADEFQASLVSDCDMDTFQDFLQYFLNYGVKGRYEFNNRDMREAVLSLFSRHVNHPTLLTALMYAVDFDYLEELLGTLYWQYCGPAPSGEIDDEENPGH